MGQKIGGYSVALFVGIFVGWVSTPVKSITVLYTVVSFLAKRACLSIWQRERTEKGRRKKEKRIFCAKLFVVVANFLALSGALFTRLNTTDIFIFSAANQIISFHQKKTHTTQLLYKLDVFSSFHNLVNSSLLQICTQPHTHHLPHWEQFSTFHIRINR